MPKIYYKTLGSAHYEARWIARSNLVRLTASGILPCSNYFAQLEKRPERVIPPMWNFVFYVEDSCEKALRPFSQSVVLVHDGGSKNILVHDATGIQEVPILQANEPSLSDEKSHVVYARLPKEEGRYSGCQVAAADTLLNAYHYKAFGPASWAACEEFLQKHSAENQQVTAPSGEIPWPLMS